MSTGPSQQKFAPSFRPSQAPWFSPSQPCDILVKGVECVGPFERTQPWWTQATDLQVCRVGQQWPRFFSPVVVARMGPRYTCFSSVDSLKSASLSPSTGGQEWCISQQRSACGLGPLPAWDSLVLYSFVCASAPIPHSAITGRCFSRTGLLLIGLLFLGICWELTRWSQVLTSGFKERWSRLF
jgi:hypothetical protein